MATTPLLISERASADGVVNTAQVREDHSDPQLVSLSGTLVSHSPDELVLRDGDGREHRLRVTELTRYVWSETTSPKDFGPGARIRADFTSSSRQQLLHSVWVLGRS